MRPRGNLLCYALVLFLWSSFAQQDLKSPIHFEKGKSAAVIDGAVVLGTRNHYFLKAKKGQKMSVEISSAEENATFTILNPQNKVIPGTEEEKDATSWTGFLPSDGQYNIRVGATRGNAEFKLKVAIQ